jgi:hypothetical protein
MNKSGSSIQNPGAGVHFPVAPVISAKGLAGIPTACAETAGSLLETAAARSPIWRTGVHEAGHICASRFQNLEVAGSTVVEGPDYSGLTWASGSNRALRGKAAFDCDGEAAHDAVAVRVAASISRFVPAAGESRDDAADIFSGVQAHTIAMMAGGAAEMVFLGDAPPLFMASDLLSANAISGIVCHTRASIAAFVEYAFQEALALIEQNKPVVLALAQALIDHPERTLNGVEIDQVIADALDREAMKTEIARRANWADVLTNAATFAAHGLES